MRSMNKKKEISNVLGVEREYNGSLRRLPSKKEDAAQKKNMKKKQQTKRNEKKRKAAPSQQQCLKEKLLK